MKNGPPDNFMPTPEPIEEEMKEPIEERCAFEGCFVNETYDAHTRHDRGEPYCDTPNCHPFTPKESDPGTSNKGDEEHSQWASDARTVWVCSRCSTTHTGCSYRHACKPGAGVGSETSTGSDELFKEEENLYGSEHARLRQAKRERNALKEENEQLRARIASLEGALETIDMLARDIAPLNTAISVSITAAKIGWDD